VIDIVKDPISDTDYNVDEDPKLYRSQKTGRGPLTDQWVQNWRDNQISGSGCKNTLPPMMCAYKVCRVEFRYWGMQSKIEKFIHDQGALQYSMPKYLEGYCRITVALRRTMLRAHRQAWAWQDEWFGLTIDDIRVLERKAQEILKKKVYCRVTVEKIFHSILLDGSDGNGK